MIDTIKKILKKIDVDHWKILDKTVESKELFFIRKDLDMNRAKKVHSYGITLYKDFEEKGEWYTGSASVNVSTGMEEDQIFSILEKAALSASFVKNPYYPMVELSEKVQPRFQSRFDTADVMPFMSDFRDCLYKNDIFDKGGINSAEIFLGKSELRLMTSTGIDVRFKKFNGEIELITDWNENNESVELYNMFYFSDFCPELIEEEAKIQIENSRDRALAIQAKELKKINIILSTDAVKDVMNFYVSHSSASAVYEQISKAKIGEIFQGENVKGDLLNIKLNPFMINSPDSAPYDDDGFPLSEQILFEKGVLKKIHGSLQYTSYLKLEPTGTIHNVEVQGGTKSYEDFKKEPYVEILNFSDFQMNTMTGDFGGEIRLARYFDGEKIVPITGASISANLFTIQHEMYLSKEVTQRDNYIGPRALLFPNGHIAGA
ncbi:MAG: metallopeptidase TldD-related protein [Spirochaetaceae bacterium]|jgi:predicted Zn-dependent protease|nr:metallopeptidase TldD-related protein [Spirochaetaceae bacterium]